MGNKKSEMLTQTELAVMKLFWACKEGTVREVRAMMPNPNDVPYTTVAAVVRLLAGKGFLNSRMTGKTLHYSPRVSKTDYEQKAISQIVTKLFDGDTVDLATRLIDTDDLTVDELELIREEIEKKIKHTTGKT